MIKCNVYYGVTCFQESVKETSAVDQGLVKSFVNMKITVKPGQQV